MEIACPYPGSAVRSLSAITPAPAYRRVFISSLASAGERRGDVVRTISKTDDLPFSFFLFFCFFCNPDNRRYVLVVSKKSREKKGSIHILGFVGRPESDGESDKVLFIRDSRDSKDSNRAALHVSRVQRRKKLDNSQTAARGRLRCTSVLVSRCHVRGDPRWSTLDLRLDEAAGEHLLPRHKLVVRESIARK